MANRFWVGGTGTWDTSTTTHWASTSGGGGGASAPTAADDVFIDTNSGGGTITLSAAVCRSLDCTGAPATTIAFASSTLAVGDGSGGAFKLVANITVTNTAGTLNFVSTSNNGGTGWAITTANKSLPTTNFNGAGGKWVLQDTSTWASGITLRVQAGTFVGNGQTWTCGVFDCGTGTATRAADITNCTITCTSANGNVCNFGATGLTLTTTGSTITISGSAGNLSTGGGAFTFATMNFTGAAFQTLNTSSLGTTFTNLTRTGTAAKTDGFQLTNPITVTGTLTVGGNTVQGVNRLIFGSSIPGTQRTITATGATVVISGDVDFMDIAITGSPTWTNTGSKFVGDAGGNGALITTNMTTPATQTWNGDVSDNWSTTARWTSRVPLPQDDVVINQAFTGTKTITEDMPRFGKNIDFTGTTGNPRFTTGVNGATFYGSMKLVSGMTAPQGTSQWTAGGRGNFTITSSGVPWNNSFNFNGVGGTYTLQDAFTCNFTLTVNDGTWVTNDNAVTCQLFNATSGRTTALTLGTSAITLTATTVTNLWNDANGSTSVTGTPSMTVSTASTNTRTIIKKGGSTISTLTYTVASSPGTLVIDTNTASTITITTFNIGSGRGLQLASSKTYSTTGFNVNGAANGYLYLPGIASNYASTPDAAPLQLTGDMTVEAKFAADTWVPSATGYFVSKGTAGNTGGIYSLGLNSQGKLVFVTSNGVALTTWVSSVATGLAAGALKWVRGSFQINDGAGHSVVRFYTSDDGSAWTQLGSDVQNAGVVTVQNAAQTLAIGAISGGTSPLAGAMYRARVYGSDLRTSSGTPVFDADLTRNVSSSGWLDAAHTQFAESSSNAATVTINGSLAQAGDGRIILNSSTAGTRATLSKTSGIVSCNYLSIKDSAADGGASWHALSSADAGNNTGWIFGSTPSTSTNFLIFGGPQ